MSSILQDKELKLVVVGDVGCGKTNFIQKFLFYYPVISESHRGTNDIYLSRIQDKRIRIPSFTQKMECRRNTIRLYNVNDVKIVSDPKFYDEFDVIFYCYASDDPESFQNLGEKWIPQMKSKVQYSFLVANLSTQKNSLVQKQQSTVSTDEGERLKKRFHIQSFVQQTDDYERLFKILDSFINHALSKLYRKKFPEEELDIDNEEKDNIAREIS